MLHCDTIDISEGTDINRTIPSKDYNISQY